MKVTQQCAENEKPWWNLNILSFTLGGQTTRPNLKLYLRSFWITSYQLSGLVLAAQLFRLVGSQLVLGKTPYFLSQWFSFVGAKKCSLFDCLPNNPLFACTRVSLESQIVGLEVKEAYNHNRKARVGGGLEVKEVYNHNRKGNQCTSFPQLQGQGKSGM